MQPAEVVNSTFLHRYLSLCSRKPLFYLFSQETAKYRQQSHKPVRVVVIEQLLGDSMLDVALRCTRSRLSARLGSFCWTCLQATEQLNFLDYCFCCLAGQQSSSGGLAFIEKRTVFGTSAPVILCCGYKCQHPVDIMHRHITLCFGCCTGLSAWRVFFVPPNWEKIRARYDSATQQRGEHLPKDPCPS